MSKKLFVAEGVCLLTSTFRCTHKNHVEKSRAKITSYIASSTSFIVMEQLTATRDFVYTTSIKKLRGMKSRVKVVCGGSSAGKTFGILPVLIDRATRNGGLEISVVSESVPHLRRGAMKDFKKIMMATGRWFEDRWNSTLMTYTFANGSYIEFFSADDQGKVRGPRRNVLYVNECNNVPYETYFQLAIRTSEEVWLDYNPVEDFYVNTELIGQDGVEFMRLTYRDNEALSQSIVDELEKCRYKGFWDTSLPETELFRESNIKNPYWARWWRVYGLGYEGVLEGIIFQNWTKVESVPPMAKFLGYGLDFGYANDPTAVVGLWKHGDGYYINEVLYEKGLTNQDLGRSLRDRGVGSSDLIVADSAEPKSIEELRRMGFKGIRKAKKGKDSILQGIQLLQAQELMVTSDSVNLIKELRGYVWETDRDGKHINKPIDVNNHLIDSLRYISQQKIGKSGGFVVSSGKVIYSN
jgi:phage terminase large subunit